MNFNKYVTLKLNDVLTSIKVKYIPHIQKFISGTDSVHRYGGKYEYPEWFDDYKQLCLTSATLYRFSNDLRVLAVEEYQDSQLTSVKKVFTLSNDYGMNLIKSDINSALVDLRINDFNLGICLLYTSDAADE